MIGGATHQPRLLAEFQSVDAMLAAVRALRSAHYHDIDTFAPFDIPEVDGALGLGRSRMGWITLAGGLAGMVATYGIQWWANVHSYPLNAGGRPPNAVPAFIFPTFEGTILGASLAAFVGLFVVLGLPRLWSPEDEVDGFQRASIDRFWIGMPTFASEQDRAHAARLLTDAGALRTITLGRV